MMVAHRAMQTRYPAAVAAVQRLTKPEDVVLIDPANAGRYGETPELPRLLDRPTLVHGHMIPTDASELYRWYRNLQWRAALFERGCTPQTAPVAPFKYLLVLRLDARPIVAHCGDVIWSNDTQELIRIRP
jgi:hypothetical protein